MNVYLLVLGLLGGVALLVDKALLAHDLEGIVDGVELGAGVAVRVEFVVSPGEVLAVVASKVHVVERVVSWRVDNTLKPVAGDHVAVVDKDGPDLDEDEKNEVEVLLHWADINKNAVESG